MRKVHPHTPSSGVPTMELPLNMKHGSDHVAMKAVASGSTSAWHIEDPCKTPVHVSKYYISATNDNHHTRRVWLTSLLLLLVIVIGSILCACIYTNIGPKKAFKNMLNTSSEDQNTGSDTDIDTASVISKPKQALSDIRLTENMPTKLRESFSTMCSAVCHSAYISQESFVRVLRLIKLHLMPDHLEAFLKFYDENQLVLEVIQCGETFQELLVKISGASVDNCRPNFTEASNLFLALKKENVPFTHPPTVTAIIQELKNAMQDQIDYETHFKSKIRKINVKLADAGIQVAENPDQSMSLNLVRAKHTVFRWMAGLTHLTFGDNAVQSLIDHSVQIESETIQTLEKFGAQLKDKLPDTRDNGPDAMLVLEQSRLKEFMEKIIEKTAISQKAFVYLLRFMKCQIMPEVIKKMVDYYDSWKLNSEIILHWEVVRRFARNSGLQMIDKISPNYDSARYDHYLMTLPQEIYIKETPTIQILFDKFALAMQRQEEAEQAYVSEILNLQSEVHYSTLSALVASNELSGSCDLVRAKHILFRWMAKLTYPRYDNDEIQSLIDYSVQLESKTLQTLEKLVAQLTGEASAASMCSQHIEQSTDASERALSLWGKLLQSDNTGSH